MDDEVYGEPPSYADVAAMTAIIALAVDKWLRDRARRTTVENAKVDPAKPKCRWVVEADACEFCKARGGFWFDPVDMPLGSHSGCKCYTRQGYSADSSQSVIKEANDELPEETRIRVLEEEKRINKEINAAWSEFKKRETEEHYQETVGKMLDSYSSVGRISAEYRAKPKGKEIMAAAKMAKNGHDIMFLAELGGGKHADALIDGIKADFKRMESEKKGKVLARIKDAAAKPANAVIDLSLRTMSVEDAASAARWAIEDNILPPGAITILDWNGLETIV